MRTLFACLAFALIGTACTGNTDPIAPAPALSDSGVLHSSNKCTTVRPPHATCGTIKGVCTCTVNHE